VIRRIYQRRGYKVLNRKPITTGTIEITFTARSYGNRRRNNYYCKLICYDCDTATTTTKIIPATELTTGEPITDVTTADMIPTTAGIIPTETIIDTTTELTPTTPVP
jgi:hypothetical protein